MGSLSHLCVPIAQADALIFDMDGTVIDSMPAHYQAWQQVAEAYQLALTEERFYQLGGVPTWQTLEILSRESGRQIDIASAKAMKEAAYNERLDQITVLAPALTIIEATAGSKPMAIATGASKCNALQLLSAFNLQRYFSAVVTADDVSNHKPAPDVFLAAAAQLGVPASTCLAFEDTDIGLAAIRAAGMRGVDVRDYSLNG